MKTFFLICYIVAGLCWLIVTAGHFMAGRPKGEPLNVGWLLPFGLVWFIIPSIIVAGQSVDGP
jgi:hypothetical protein